MSSLRQSFLSVIVLPRWATLLTQGGELPHRIMGWRSQGFFNQLMHFVFDFAGFVYLKNVRPCSLQNLLAICSILWRQEVVGESKKFSSLYQNTPAEFFHCQLLNIIVLKLDSSVLLAQLDNTFQYSGWYRPSSAGSISSSICQPELGEY